MFDLQTVQSEFSCCFCQPLVVNAVLVTHYATAACLIFESSCHLMLCSLRH
jgi:hypothetical protein